MRPRDLPRPAYAVGRLTITRLKRRDFTMDKLLPDEHVLPRPVGRLPEYAHAKARQTLAAKFIEAFPLSNEAASTIANAVVDPSAVRKSIVEPTDPRVEEISVPGGTLLGIETT